MSFFFVFFKQVECSSLTGEADLVPASVDKKHDIPAEARNIVFMSSLAMNGEGRGIVIRTGKQLVLQGTTSVFAGACASWRPKPAGACFACQRGPARQHVLRCIRGCVMSVAGDQTMIGKIATLATGTHTHKSTLQVGGVAACQLRYKRTADGSTADGSTYHQAPAWSLCCALLLVVLAWVAS